MKSTPKGWPRIVSAVFYDDPKKAIEFLTTAFGFTPKLIVEGDDGRIEHSELMYGEGMIMVGGASGAAGGKRDGSWRKSPRSAGGGTQSMMVFVDDADAHAAHAKAAGATIASEPETHDYGDDYWADRTYEAVDLEGHHWWFTQRMRDPKE